MLSLLDLFSGIGGFSLGMEATKRINTVAFCEKDEYCRKVLKKHWSNTQQYIDIRDIDGTKISADIISGGFPCQPFSVAGKRKGTTDDRYLWDEMLRVITEVKPRWVVGENVQGIINIDNGLVLRQVQTDLEAQGFQVQCFIIPASGIGAWHQRKRVWIIGCNVSNPKHTGPQNKSRRGFRELEKESKGEKETRNQSSLCFTTGSSDVSNSKSKRSFSTSQSESGVDEQQRLDNDKERNRSEIRSNSSRCSEQNVPNSKSSIRNVIHSDKEFGKAQTQEISGNGNSLSEQKQSETWWQTESKLRRVPDGICTGLDKDRANRIKSLGNSIVPQIAFEIGKAILAAEDDKEHSIQKKEY